MTAEAIGCHILPHGREQPLTLAADAAADEHHLRPQNVHQIGDACGHIDVILRQHRLRRLIAAVCRVKHVLGGESVAAARQKGLRMRQSCPPSLPDQGSGGAVGLPAAFTSAGARLAVQYQYGVSRLGAGAAHALQQLAVGHDAHAHAGAQRHQHHIAAAHGGARHRLCQRCAVGVVAEPAGKPQPRRHHVAHGYVEPTQIVRPHHHAAAAVAGAGGADADAGAVRRRDARLGHGQLRRQADVRHHRFCAALRAGGYADLRHDVLRFIHHAGGNVGAAQINADTIHVLPPAKYRAGLRPPRVLRTLRYGSRSRCSPPQAAQCRTSGCCRKWCAWWSAPPCRTPPDHGHVPARPRTRR